MAVVLRKAINYIKQIGLNGDLLEFDISYDPILKIGEYFQNGYVANGKNSTIESNPEIYKSYNPYWEKNKIVGIAEKYFDRAVIELKKPIKLETERKIIALKLGFPHLPAKQEN